MRSILRIAVFLSFTSAALASNTITGSVRNQSRGQPAVGDEVTLIRIDHGMQVEKHTRTNALGAFSLDMQHPDNPYLVRVKHQDVNYDQRAPVGGAMTISVFDVADHVPGISGTIEILRAGTAGKSLHVSDMIEVNNASSPPFTQTGESTFEVCLPSDAKLDSVLAAGPEKIGMMVSAVPVSGKPGHYAVNFPLQPGATKFAFNYDLPYKGYVAFRTWHLYPLEQLAVMIPTTMEFSSLSSKFQILRTGAGNYRVRAIGPVTAGQGPTFVVSGTGDFPPLPDQTKPKTPSQLPVLPKSSVSASDSNAPPLSGQTKLDPAASSLWLTPQALLIGCALLAACALIAWRAREVYRNVARGYGIPSAVRPATLLDGLKNELFQLESDRILGAISGEKYASARQAWEQVVEHAVAGRRDDSSKRD